MVLLSHGRHFLLPIWDGASFFRVGGFIGVELFFVLSGFLIGTIAWQSFKVATKETPWIFDFLKRRWLRTLPNYYLFLAVNWAFLFLAIIPGHPADLKLFLVFAQNLAWRHPPVFGEAWSLAVEEIFYLIFPLGLLVLGAVITCKRTVFLTVTATLLITPLLARFLAVEMHDPPWDEGVRKVVIFRLDALMVGVLGAWLSCEKLLPRIREGAWPFLFGVLVLGATIGIFFFLAGGINANDFARIWLFPIVSIGCLFFVLSGLKWNANHARVASSMEYCARWSYAIYLAHMPVFHLILWSHGPAQQGDVWGAFARWGAFVLGSVAVAALVERFFERPILRWRDRVAPR